MARSSFYYQVKQNKLPDKYKVIKKLIQSIYHKHKGRYGYRRITDELKNKGIIINHKTVLRLMKLLGLKSIIRLKKYKSYKGEQGKIAPNILERNFKATAPNQKWATDITEFNVAGKKLYLSPIIDLFNQEIISYELTERPVFNQVVMMLKKAFKKIPNNTNLTLHSDQGWQYQMKQYQYLLKEKGIIQSMSRKGNCLDNAIIENFFGTLKSELFYIKKFRTIEELKKLPAESYQIIDVRDEIEISHGAVKGALACKPEEIMENPEVDKTRKLVICCSRGINSKEIAKKLEEEGLDAVSLEKGYIAWLMDAMKSSQDEDFVKNVEISLRKKFKKKIWSRFTKAINTYELVKPGDRIAVCISGGKDSMLMAKCFQELKLHNKFDFEVKFLVMDPGYSPANRQVIEENARRLNIPIRIFESDIFESVFNVEKSPCYLCARMRRGHLYAFAKEMGCNKIALGHHYDDVIETILMGMLYGAQVQTMMPKLHSTNFEGMELIRPLYLVREDDIKAWRDYNDLHFIQCACKFTDTCTTCNNENRSKRVEIKELIRDLKKVNPFVEGNIFKSVENVNIDTVVGYKQYGVRHSFLENYDGEPGSASENAADAVE